jgi:uncharacterized RDD family membrane protein YckC
VVLAVPQEGSLAPDLMRDNVEPMRALPGTRKRERTWKDEVRDRVKQRKEQRDGELPLFQDEPEVEEPADLAEEPAMEALPPEPAAAVEPEPAPLGIRELGDDDDLGPEPEADRELLLHAGEKPDELLEDASALPSALLEPEEEPVVRWSLGPRGAGGDEPAPVERPAPLLARAEAALMDLVLLGVLGAGVVALTARAAQVPLRGLLPSWPWLAGYLAAMGLLYAGYFTGGTGRTLGKIAFGLYVVDANGQRPGFLRALARAALGSIGILLAGGGLVPMLLDPARRALHDRLFGTRVIRA